MTSEVPSSIPKHQLGRTGIEITPIGLGVMQFAGGSGVFRFMFPRVPQELRNEIVKKAIDGGINWFDTAEAYGGGRSERGLAQALKAAGQEDAAVVVATKWRPHLRTAGNISKTIGDRYNNPLPDTSRTTSTSYLTFISRDRMTSNCFCL